MSPDQEDEKKGEDREADFLLGELIGWIGQMTWAVIAGIVAAVTE